MNNTFKKEYLWTTLIFLSLILCCMNLYIVTSIRLENSKFKKTLEALNVKL